MQRIVHEQMRSVQHQRKCDDAGIGFPRPHHSHRIGDIVCQHHALLECTPES